MFVLRGLSRELQTAFRASAHHVGLTLDQAAAEAFRAFIKANPAMDSHPCGAITVFDPLQGAFVCVTCKRPASRGMETRAGY